MGDVVRLFRSAPTPVRQIEKLNSTPPHWKLHFIPGNMPEYGEYLRGRLTMADLFDIHMESIWKMIIG